MGCRCPATLLLSSILSYVSPTVGCSDGANVEWARSVTPSSWPMR
jgi:hypothetical protein